MLESKFFTIMLIITLLLAGATLALQVLEMRAYSLF